MTVDYSLYLVTDSTPAILGSRDILSVVEAALRGGVSIVQYRNKTADTAELIDTARKLHQLTKAHGVPLLINDRIDVALAVGAEGVHIGQDDMDLPTARRILGDGAIIGVTAATVDEALAAAKDGADYLGIGTVYATPTKEDTKSIIGAVGVQEILSALARSYRSLPTVCIGGINASNAQRIFYQCHAPSKRLDGIAVVSAIMAAKDPTQAAQNLKSLVTSYPPFGSAEQPRPASVDEVLQLVAPTVKKLGEQNPICHNMTNLVVQNIAANVALCIGASPIMSNYGEEGEDLAALGGALVINMGTVTPDGLQNYLKSLRSYNAVGAPVLFDPVGAGATKERRAAVKTLMTAGYFDVIKGNEGEIKAVAGLSGAQQHGVDSGASTLSLQEKVALVQSLAHREKNVVLMTGKTDVLSDGIRTFAVSNGHEYLGAITGSGCSLGTTIAAFLAVERSDKLLAVLAGVLMFEIAAERAAAQGSVRGPGSFVPAFLDELYAIRLETAKGDNHWLADARVSGLDGGS